MSLWLLSAGTQASKPWPERAPRPGTSARRAAGDPDDWACRGRGPGRAALRAYLVYGVINGKTRVINGVNYATRPLT